MLHSREWLWVFAAAVTSNLIWSCANSASCMRNSDCYRGSVCTEGSCVDQGEPSESDAGERLGDAGID